MGSRQAFSQLKLEDIQKLLGLDAPMLATPTRMPQTEEDARSYFANEIAAAKKKPAPQTPIVPAVDPNAGRLVGQAVMSPAPTPPPSIEDILKIEEPSLPKKEDLTPLLSETTAFSPELNAELTKYAATLNQADMSPWAALADKWSGGGKQLANVAKDRNTAGSLDREKLRQESIANRQQVGIQSNVAKDYINQLERDIKPLQDVNRAGKAAKINLTPDAQGNVEVAKVENIAALAGRALANIGVQTDRDATRTVLPTLELTIGRVLAYIKSKPDQPVPFTLVKPLLETLNSVERAYREEVNEKVGVTRDAYISGRGLAPDRADVVLSPYKKLLEAQAERLEDTESTILDITNPAAGARARAIKEAIKKAKGGQ